MAALQRRMVTAGRFEAQGEGGSSLAAAVGAGGSLPLLKHGGGGPSAVWSPFFRLARRQEWREAACPARGKIGGKLQAPACA